MMAAEAIQGLRLDQLLDGIADSGQAAAVCPRDISLDSRQIGDGGLFLACAGLDGRSHGLDHVEEAVRRGAIAVLWEPVPGRAPPPAIPAIAVPELSRQASRIADRFFGQPSGSMRVIGVTGTNGKTSISHLIAMALEQLAQPAGLLGTLGAGRPDQLREVSHTTADAVTVQAQLAELAQSGASRVAMEVSSHGLSQHRVDAVRFRGALFSNLSHDHLDYHGHETAYAEAKRALFLHPELEWAVINADDYWADHMASALSPGVACIRVSGQDGSPAADLVRFRHHPRPDGLRVDITGALGEAIIDSAWMGHFNAFNLAAAFAVLRLEGMAASEAASALGAVPAVPGRMERFGGCRQPTVVVDYAHTPDALSQVLSSLREHTAGRLWCVFGCGGDRDREKRPVMGQIAARLADEVIVTDDNPRSEAGEQIVADILRGAGREARVCRDRGEAIEQAIRRARPGDVVLIAGKGHESVQIVGEERHRFSDRDQVLALLEEAGS